MDTEAPEGADPLGYQTLTASEFADNVSSYGACTALIGPGGSLGEVEVISRKTPGLGSQGTVGLGLGSGHWMATAVAVAGTSLLAINGADFRAAFGQLEHYTLAPQRVLEVGV
jgi:hypothetical protein